MTHLKILSHSAILIATVVLTVLGCATSPPPISEQWENTTYLEYIHHPVTYRIAVNSEPPGATVYQDDTVKGTTPITIEINTEFRVQRTCGAVRNLGTGEVRKNPYCTTMAPDIMWLPLGQTTNHTNITVYKDGYRRQTRTFAVNDRNLFSNIFSHPEQFRTLSDTWTAFLEKIPTTPDIDLKIKIRQPQ